jgi:hypothetical protein
MDMGGIYFFDFFIGLQRLFTNLNFRVYGNTFPLK